MTGIRCRRSHQNEGSAMINDQNDSKDSNGGHSTKPLKISENVTKASTKEKAVQVIWCLHFFLGFLVVYAGIVKNGGDRKYVRLDPVRIGRNCSKAFANVHSSSVDEPYAFVCCTNDDDKESTTSNGVWDFLSSHAGSYEAALCSDKVGSVFGMSLTSFPCAWILPLIPLVLRMIIISYQRMLHKVPCRNNNNAWGARSRFVLYFFIMNFRGWALYLLLNNVEDAIVEWTSSPYFSNSSNPRVSVEVINDQMPLQSAESSSCWYQEYLYYESQRAKACYGQEFDFSDHVVLFFGQILPVAIFEVLFCILVPLYNTTESRNDKNLLTKKEKTTEEDTPLMESKNEAKPLTDLRRPGTYSEGRCSRSETLIVYAAQLLLFVGFLYLNAMTFMAVHSTAAYFHTAGEVMVGYIVSLFVQLPLGYLILHESHHPTKLTNSTNGMRNEQHPDAQAKQSRRNCVANRIRAFIGFP